MRLADDRRQVMLAMALEADVLQDDHLVVAVGLLEGALQELVGVAAIAREILLEGAHHPRRRALQALALRIIARPAQQRAHRRLRLGPRRARELIAAFWLDGLVVDGAEARGFRGHAFDAPARRGAARRNGLSVRRYQLRRMG